LLDSSYKLRAKRGHVADKTLEPLRYFWDFSMIASSNAPRYP
jgi:hypothetical protein